MAKKQQRGKSSAGGRKRRGGARPKAPGGLTRVLYIRHEEALAGPLERLRQRMSREAGRELSMGDVVRPVLWEACRAPMRPRKAGTAGRQELATIERRLMGNE